MKRLRFRALLSVAILLALGIAMHSPARAAGAFDDLKNGLIQSFGDAAKRNLDSALGNAASAPPASTSTAQPPASVAAGASNKSQPATAPIAGSAIVGTPLDMSEPNCLVFKTGNDGGTRIQNRECVHDPVILRRSDKVEGCAWSAMKRGVSASTTSAVAICQYPPSANSCQCAGNTLWKPS